MMLDDGLHETCHALLEPPPYRRGEGGWGAQVLSWALYRVFVQSSTRLAEGDDGDSDNSELRNAETEPGQPQMDADGQADSCPEGPE